MSIRLHLLRLIRAQHFAKRLPALGGFPDQDEESHRFLVAVGTLEGIGAERVRPVGAQGYDLQRFDGESCPGRQLRTVLEKLSQRRLSANGRNRGHGYDGVAIESRKVEFNITLGVRTLYDIGKVGKRRDYFLMVGI